MNSILASIISTIAFYDAVGKVPLTKVELYKRLIFNEGLPIISFGDFVEFLDREWGTLESVARRYRGFYYLVSPPAGRAGNRDCYARRIQIGKTGIKKWRIAKRISRLISFLPYVRMVAITGSLALHTTSYGSDIDVLIIARHGHIWTVRALVSALLHILKSRRHGQRIQDRICLNHFVADSNLALRPLNLFSAHIFATMIRAWGKDEAQGALDAQNLNWARSYFPHLRTHGAISELRLTKSGVGWFERVLRAIQIAKIRRRFTIQDEEGRGAILDDEALVFHHPRPATQEALVLYEQHLMALGLDTFLSPIYPHNFS